MEKTIFTQEEFLQKVSISEITLMEFDESDLLKPEGYTDDHIPFYSENSLNAVSHLKKLLELGYELKEIRNIIKKVGLPKTVASKGGKSNFGKYTTIGSLAEQVGVSPRTIKHWEDKGIIESDMRTEGGFRLYSELYVYLCKLVKDLQLFGYTLEQIKVISDYFRDFLVIQNNMKSLSKEDVSNKLDQMQQEIQSLFDKMDLFSEGIQRWEELLKKKKKEIAVLKTQNQKRSEVTSGDSDA